MTSSSDTRAEDLAQQSEELFALQAIYGEDAVSVDLEERRAKILLPSADDPNMTLTLYLPESYPSSAAPVAELSGVHLSEDLVEWALQQLESHFSPGELILYSWVEWLKDQEILQPPPHPSTAPEEMDRPGTSSLRAEGAEAEDCIPEASELDRHHQSSLWQQAKIESALRAEVEALLVHGEPFTERRSTFQGHLAPVSSVHQVEQVMAVLLENGKVQRATHNIMAYRIFNEDKGSFLQDSDDDGESAAGSRLLHLLQIVEARNVVVVVSRWYGGILLGPARFTHINNAARSLLEQCGYIAKEACGRKRGKGGK